jgi:hypothetical protein
MLPALSIANLNKLLHAVKNTGYSSGWDALGMQPSVASPPQAVLLIITKHSLLIYIG